MDNTGLEIRTSPFAFTATNLKIGCWFIRQLRQHDERSECYYGRNFKGVQKRCRRMNCQGREKGNCDHARNP
jgi:hypothetical protein